MSNSLFLFLKKQIHESKTARPESELEALLVAELLAVENSGRKELITVPYARNFFPAIKVDQKNQSTL